MKIKIIALALAILAFFFFVGSPFQQAAKAIVGVDDAFIAIVIAALAALGITLVVTAEYDDLSDYVGDLLTEYAESRNMLPQNLFNGCQSGTNSLGQILINNRFVVMIQGFAAWIKAKFTLTNHSSITAVSGNGMFGGYMLYGLPFTTVTSDPNRNTFRYYATNNLAKVYALPVYRSSNSQFGVKLFSMAPFTAHKDTYDRNGYVGTYSQEASQMTYNHAIYYSDLPWSIYYSAYSDNLSMYEWITNDQYVALIQNPPQSLTEGSGADILINTGEITLPYDDPTYEEGDGAIIDIGASWGDSYDDIMDDLIPDSFSDSNEGTATIEYDSEEVVQEQVEDTGSQSISQEVDDYQVTGLTSVFPFCIPFDIYSFFECLAAEPVAPSIEWRFYVPGICDETIELDLSQFNTVAQIVRTMELLAFIVGLAFVTRDKMIKG